MGLRGQRNDVLSLSLSLVMVGWGWRVALLEKVAALRYFTGRRLREKVRLRHSRWRSLAGCRTSRLQTSRNLGAWASPSSPWLSRGGSKRPG